VGVNIICPVCKVPVEAADQFRCETGTCPARGYRPDSPQARMIVAKVERLRSKVHGGVVAGSRGMDVPEEDPLTAYERAFEQERAAAEYRAAYDQAKADAWLRDAGEQVFLRHVARPS
jgi:hypothetical protein